MSQATDQLVRKISRAMQFYLDLHQEEKGDSYKEEDAEALMRGVIRNYCEFVLAVQSSNKREILAEGIGVINHVAMIIENEADDELKALRGWREKLREIKD